MTKAVLSLLAKHTYHQWNGNVSQSHDLTHNTSDLLWQLMQGPNKTTVINAKPGNHVEMEEME